MLNPKLYFPQDPETGLGPVDLVNKNIVEDGAGQSVDDLNEEQAKQALCIYIQEHRRIHKIIDKVQELLIRHL
jgi:hypothetical protein